jgi:NAD(P)-dependent dehydrogenase (short-subunit alcohol dehydrogenase family)
MSLDLSSLHSVRALVSQLGNRKLSGLMCNAGLQFREATQSSPDGFESTFAINHLGHYLLIRSLLPQISEPGRIILVASGTHDPAQKTFMPAPIWRDPKDLARPDNHGSPAGTAGRRAYSTSKLLNVMTAYALDRRLRAEDRAVTVTAFDPGFMPGADSGLARDYSSTQQLAWKLVLPLLRYVMPRVMTPTRSGDDLAQLALSPEFSGVSGAYFEGLRQIPSSELSSHVEKQETLWRESALMCGLQP